MTQILPQCCNEEADADGAWVRQQCWGGTQSKALPPHHTTSISAVEEMSSQAGLQWSKVALLPKKIVVPPLWLFSLVLKVVGSTWGARRHWLHLFPRGSNRPHQPAGERRSGAGKY